MEPNHAEARTWLVVEDDAYIRNMLTAMMTFWNINPLAFADGFQAMAWLDQVEAGMIIGPLPELALIDIRLPGPQGYDVARRLRDTPATSNMGIVIMTAYHFDRDEVARIKASARPDLYISKPLPSPEKLRHLLERVAYRHSRRQPRREMRVSLVTPLLNDELPQIRRLAVETLGSLRLASTIPLLLARLADSDPSVRCTAIEAVSWHPSPETARAITPLLRDRHPSVRRRACEAFALGLKPIPVEDVLPRLRDEDRWTRFWAIEALRVSGSIKALSGLVRCLREGDRLVRERAIHTLAHLRFKEAIPHLEWMLDEHPEMASAIIAAIRRIDEASADAVVRRRLPAELRDAVPDMRPSPKEAPARRGPASRGPQRNAILRLIGHFHRLGDDAPRERRLIP